MPVTVKDGEDERLIRELANLTGESLTAATRRAVRERLERLRATGGREVTKDRILGLGRDIAARLDEAGVDGDHARLLYGHDGLPR